MGSEMSTIFDRETTLKALRDAAWIAKHGTREEQSGRFLPPPVAPVKRASIPRPAEASRRSRVGWRWRASSSAYSRVHSSA